MKLVRHIHGTTFYHKGPLLLGEVQRKILVSSGGVTYLVDRLEADGLVERRECPTDRRARYAALTPKGRQLMKRIFPEHAAALERAVAGLSGTEKKQAIDLLRAHTPALAGVDSTLVFSVEGGRITEDAPRSAVGAALDEVRAAIKRANKQVSRAESVRKFAIIPVEFIEANGHRIENNEVSGVPLSPLIDSDAGMASAMSARFAGRTLECTA